MSGPAQTSLHESKSDTCDISPIHNDCRKAEPGGSPAQSQRPRRSTDRWACERCQAYRRTARVIELPFIAFAQRVPQLFHFTAGLEGSPHFPRAGVPQDQSPEASEGYGYGRFGLHDRFRAARVGVRTQPSPPPSAVHVCWRYEELASSQANASFPLGILRKWIIIRRHSSGSAPLSRRYDQYRQPFARFACKTGFCMLGSISGWPTSFRVMR
jgi:hypothetical protein